MLEILLTVMMSQPVHPLVIKHGSHSSPARHSAHKSHKAHKHAGQTKKSAETKQVENKEQPKQEIHVHQGGGGLGTALAAGAIGYMAGSALASGGENESTDGNRSNSDETQKRDTNQVQEMGKS